MCRVLFTIPFLNVPLYGFGVCLVAAILTGTWLAARLAKRDGIDPEVVKDFMIPLMLFGIGGARLFYVVQFRQQFQRNWLSVFAVWEGGLVVYGAVFGMFVAVAWYCWVRRLRPLPFLDVMAPSFALGMAFGRIGCLLNGCCFGDPYGPVGVTYPTASDAMVAEIQLGQRTPFGFGTERGNRRAEPRHVAFVEPGTPAASSGLRVGDAVVELNGRDASDELAFQGAIDALWPMLFGQRAIDAPLRVTVERGGIAVPLAFALPRPRPSQPTQLYMALGNFLLLLLVLAHRPLRTRPGQSLGLLLSAYAVGRFLVEFVRADESPFPNGLTISQNISIPMLAVGLLLFGFAPRPSNEHDQPRPAGNSS